MNIYVSILRGINVSGHRMIKMDALRSLYSELGFINPQTYIQSGNVVFQSESVDQKFLEKKIKERLEATFGFDVPVIVLESNEIKQIVKSNPFVNDQSKNILHLHVTFLSDTPTKENYTKLLEGQYQPEEFELIDKSIYLYCPNGYGNSKLTNSILENKLKVSATTRNWKTTNELINLANKANKV